MSLIQDPVNCFPPEIIHEIFSYLEPEDLGRCGRVSERWQIVAKDERLWNLFDLSKLFPSTVFLDKDWKTYFGLAVQAPWLNNRLIIPILKSSCPFFKGKRVWETHTLLLMPKGLSVNKLEKLAQAPQLGNGTQYEYFNEQLQNQFGEKNVDVSNYVLITNAVLEQSMSMSFSEQKALLQAHCNYEVPDLLVAATLNIVKYVSSNEAKTRLFGSDPVTYTRVKEQINRFQVIVGGYLPNGLRIFKYHNFISIGKGLAAQRNLY
jgi:hypothetical protein